VNTAFSYAIFCAAIWLGLHYTLATFISAFLGVLFNFKTTGKLVFANRDNRRVLLFITVYALAYLLSIAVQSLCHFVGIGAYLAGFVALPPTVLFTFLSCKLFVFRTTTAKT
jgi:putative flippase GtrA